MKAPPATSCRARRRADQRAVRVFHALASPARLCIVRELEKEGERRAGDLVGCCGLGAPTVSHHLAVLRRAGVIAGKRHGREIVYRLALPCLTDLLACLEAPVPCCHD